MHDTGCLRKEALPNFTYLTKIFHFLLFGPYYIRVIKKQGLLRR